MGRWEGGRGGDVRMSGGWLKWLGLCEGLDGLMDLGGWMVEDGIEGEIGGGKFEGVVSGCVGLS